MEPGYLSPRQGPHKGPIPTSTSSLSPYDTRALWDESLYRRGEGGGDADGRALVVARPVASSINLSLYLSGIGLKGPHFAIQEPALLYGSVKRAVC